MATRNDVAKLAGVSGATVTRVISNSSLVSSETREKVLEAVRALNYHPNYSGQLLRGKSTYQILFYCPELYNPFYVHVYYGMDDYAQKHGYSIVLTRHFDEEAILRGRYDGIVLSISHKKKQQPHMDFLTKSDIPFACALFSGEETDILGVKIDGQQAAKRALDHLYGLGHRQIVYVTDVAEEYDGKWEKLREYAKTLDGVACSRMVLKPGPELYDNLYEAGYLYADHIYRMIHLPTAVIAANDALATGLISGLQQKGMRLPEELSVIGFDDTFMTRFTVPPLTTVHFPKYEMGQTLIEGLLAVINGNKFENVSLPSRLIVRESTAQAPDIQSPC